VTSRAPSAGSPARATAARDARGSRRPTTAGHAGHAAAAREPPALTASAGHARAAFARDAGSRLGTAARAARAAAAGAAPDTPVACRAPGGAVRRAPLTARRSGLAASARVTARAEPATAGRDLATARPPARGATGSLRLPARAVDRRHAGAAVTPGSYADRGATGGDEDHRPKQPRPDAGVASHPGPPCGYVHGAVTSAVASRTAKNSGVCAESEPLPAQRWGCHSPSYQS